MLRRLLAAGIAAWLAGPVVAQEKTQPLLMLDFVFLAEGKSLADRDAYNAKALPVAGKHDVDFVASLDVFAMLKGPAELARLDVWTLPDPSALVKWDADPAYQPLKPLAFDVHDMDVLTLYLGLADAVPEPPEGEYFLIEVLTFADSFEREAFPKYLRERAKIAGTHEISHVGRVHLRKKLTGAMPDADWVNVYHLPSKAALVAWTEDAQTKAQLPVRTTLFDLSRSVVGVFRAN